MLCFFEGTRAESLHRLRQANPQRNEPMRMNNYAKIAKESRRKVLELVFKAQTSHIGSLLGAADIMAVLFEKIDFDKDKFIAGKSWLAALLYYHLWRKGKITEDELNSFCQPGSKFIGLVEPMSRMAQCAYCAKERIQAMGNNDCKHCGGIGLVEDKFIPFGIGSMGYGFPAAVGFALSKKLKGEEGTVYCLMSDGEMNCGTTWEAALIAAHHKLDNLVVVVDRNFLQAMGRTEDILALEPLDRKWESFGWSVEVGNGHDYGNIDALLEYRHQFQETPFCLIAKTTKGKGWKRAHSNNLYHYKQLSQDEYEEALKEINV